MKPESAGDRVPQVATLLEARRILRLGERTFRDLVRRGELPVVALSRRRRGVLVEDLRKYLASHRQVG
jgi:hypothetical protein